MQKQLIQIWKTYWLQPRILLLWLALAAGVIAFFIANFNRYSKLAPSLTSYSGRESFHSFSHHYLQQPGDASTQLNLPPFPNELKSLTVKAEHLKHADNQLIASLPHLKQLSLESQTAPAGLLTSLAPQLTELRLHTSIVLSHADELPQLKHLQLLIIDDQNLTQNLFKSIATIPNLRYLIIQHDITQHNSRFDRYEFGELDLPPDTLKPLLNHKSLQGIFGNWEYQGKLHSSYPSLVFPTFQQQRLIYTTYMSWWVIGFAMLLVISQNFTLLKRPQAHLTPNLIRPHLTVAAAIFSAIALVCCIRLMLLGPTFINALAVLLLPLSLFAIIENLFSPHQLITAFMLISLQLLQPLYSTEIIPAHTIGLYQSFLEGHFPLIAFVMVIIEITIISLTYSRKAYLLGLSPDPTRRFEFINKLSPGTANKPTVLTTHQYANSFWQQVLLWRAGNSWRSQRIFSFLLIMLFLIFFGPRGNPQPLISLFPFMALMPILMTGTFLTYSWRERNKSLAAETLRPIPKSSLTFQLLIAILIDYLLLSVVTCLLFGIGLLIPSFHDRTTEILYTLPLFLALITFLGALSTLLFIESRFTMTLALLPIFLPAMLFSPTLLIKPIPFLSNLSIPILLISLPLSATIISIAYYRTLTHEWGNPKT